MQNNFNDFGKNKEVSMNTLMKIVAENFKGKK